MSDAVTIRQIVAMWPSRADLAADIDLPGDQVSVDRVDKWVQRSSIPPRYHARIIRAAERRGLALSAADLVLAHDRSRSAA